MASVLLTALKITGISLLVILGLVLFILLALLFVPVRYRVNGNYLDRNDYKADMRASWLLHTVSLLVDYCSGQARRVRIRLLGFTLYDNFKAGRRKKTMNKKRKRTKTKSKSTGEIQAASTEVETSFGHEPDLAAGNDYNDEKPKECIGGYTDGIVAEEEKKRPNVFRKIKEFFIKIADFFKNIKFTFKKICATIITIKDNIKYYLEIWRLDSTQRAVAVCQKQLGRVWKDMKPKKFRLDFHLGFDDPALTGEVLAVWGMLYPVHLGAVDIRPEFDRNVFEGSFAMKGSVSLFVLLKAAVILYRDKNLRILVKQLKKEIDLEV